MKQEDKDLLLTDLCARLPYDVLVLNKDGDVESFTWQELKEFGDGYISKPYLRPMDSMTEEEYDQLYIDSRVKNDSIDILDALENDMDAIDWLLKNHFDFRGLIPKGLAIEVTEENNPYKE